MFSECTLLEDIVEMIPTDSLEYLVSKEKPKEEDGEGGGRLLHADAAGSPSAVLGVCVVSVRGVPASGAVRQLETVCLEARSLSGGYPRPFDGLHHHA